MSGLDINKVTKVNGSQYDVLNLMQIQICVWVRACVCVSCFSWCIYFCFDISGFGNLCVLLQFLARTLLKKTFLNSIQSTWLNKSLIMIYMNCGKLNLLMCDGSGVTLYSTSTLPLSPHTANSQCRRYQREDWTITHRSIWCTSFFSDN